MPDHDTSAIPKHYTDHKVTPVELIAAYDLNFPLGCAIKHITRHKEKLGREDIKKALWYVLFELTGDVGYCNYMVQEVEAFANPNT